MNVITGNYNPNLNNNKNSKPSFTSNPAARKALTERLRTTNPDSANFVEIKGIKFLNLIIL